MDRIISKEEEREDPRRELQSIFEYSGVSTNTTRTTRFLRIQCILQCFYTQSSHPVLETNSSTRNTTTTRLIPCRSVQGIFQQLLPCLQALHTADSSYKAPYSIPGPYSTSRLPVILPGRNSILHGSQHPCSPYSNSQASSTVLHYRILPGEIGFFPKG